MKRSLPLFLFAFLCGLLSSPAVRGDESVSPEQAKFFEQHIRPLLARRCYKCHGKDKQRGELRLDSKSGLLRGGESGSAFDAESPEASLLLEAVRYDGLEMPPDGKLPPAEIALLEKWVRTGAAWPGGAGAPEPKASRPAITDEDRAHWAFQPVRRPALPPEDDWSRNPIDRFVWRKLQQNGLTPADPAPPEMLIRRLFFTVIGLPPTPEDVDRFVRDPSPEAYAKLVDDLLARPGYGEKWARHWLDLVRYAESDGYKQDAYRPQAWRYRDYVIRALNSDKPYDQFVREQLAGDELDPRNPDAVVATGYLRHWIYEYNQRDVRTQWENIVNDVTDVTADVFLGMGLGCARCHDHKFDPILRRDYYRIRSFFAAISPRDATPIGESKQVEAYRRSQAKWSQATAKIRREIDALQEPFVHAARKAAADKFPLDIRPMIMAEPNERKPLEQQLADMAWRQLRTEVEKIDYAKKLKGDKKKRWEQLQSELAKFDSLKPKPLPTAPTVGDIGPTAPVTMIPGDRRKREIAPGFLSVLDASDLEVAPLERSTGRRAALARWIGSRDNPLSTRVIVNRVWQYHFGRGLVETSSDFGTLGKPPSHPELLDWLTAEFLDEGWRLKHLHRLILTSATFRQTSLRPPPEIARSKDPGNRWLWKMPVRRLDAEQIRDTLLSASGELKRNVGGPSVADSALRRSIYSKVLRNTPDPLLRAFDGTDGFFSTAERNVTTTPTQSLMMINGPWTLARAESLAARLAKEESEDDGRIVAAFRYAYGRYPSDGEMQSAVRFLKGQTRLLRSAEQPNPRLVPFISKKSPADLAVNLGPQAPLQTLSSPASRFTPSDQFTLEADFVLRSLYPDATVRTILSQWDDNKSHRGWALGVTSTKSAYQPRNLILQLIGKNKAGKMTYEVVASDLRPELNQPYRVRVTVDMKEAGAQGVRFELTELFGAKKTSTAQRKHSVLDAQPSELDLVLGGRHGAKRHRWDGLLDNVRIRNRDQLSGEWTFDSEQTMLDDSRGNFAPLAAAGNVGLAPERQAWVDLCHALLNSNEILYID